MAMMRTLMLPLSTAAAAIALSGCLATTPSYYSERVTARPAAGAVAADPVVEEATPHRRTGRRAAASKPSNASAARRGEPETSSEGSNASISPGATAQYNTRPTATDGSSSTGSAAGESTPEETERNARRERSIRRSIDSICRGC